MAGRRVRNEADARACLASERAAGGDSTGWARAHGLDGRSLNAWRLNLGRRSKSSGRRAVTRSPLVELVPAPAAKSEARYVLEIGGARLEFGDAFSVDTLRRVLQVLG